MSLHSVSPTLRIGTHKREKGSSRKWIQNIRKKTSQISQLHPYIGTWKKAICIGMKIPAVLVLPGTWFYNTGCWSNYSYAVDLVNREFTVLKPLTHVSLAMASAHGVAARVKQCCRQHTCLIQRLCFHGHSSELSIAAKGFQAHGRWHPLSIGFRLAHAQRSKAATTLRAPCYITCLSRHRFRTSRAQQPNDLLPWLRVS